VSREVEQRLIDAGFARWSVRGDPSARGMKPMNIDYAAAAKMMPSAVREATSILEGR
jgi:hypothetical protein